MRDRSAWSPPPYVAVGRIVKAHGVRGEMRIEPYSPDADRFLAMQRIFAVDENGDRQELVIDGCRIIAQGVLLKFAGIDSPEAAAELRGRVLVVPRSEARIPPPGEVLYADMIGLLAVHAEDGTPIGTVKAIVTAGNDLLEVETPEGDVLVPWVPEFVGTVDLVGGVVPIRPIPGLLEP
jgi:16S rRNA processing protein RimM